MTTTDREGWKERWAEANELKEESPHHVYQRAIEFFTAELKEERQRTLKAMMEKIEKMLCKDSCFCGDFGCVGECGNSFNKGLDAALTALSELEREK